MLIFFISDEHRRLNQELGWLLGLGLTLAGGEPAEAWRQRSSSLCWHLFLAYLSVIEFLRWQRNARRKRSNEARTRHSLDTSSATETATYNWSGAPALRFGARTDIYILG